MFDKKCEISSIQTVGVARRGGDVRNRVQLGGRRETATRRRKLRKAPALEADSKAVSGQAVGSGRG